MGPTGLKRVKRKREKWMAGLGSKGTRADSVGPKAIGSGRENGSA